MNDFNKLLTDVRACTLCADHLPLGPRPVLQLDPMAKILIAGQAPGLKVHKSGVPFDDARGKRLRQWMGIEDHTFYDPQQIAILPMGFCFPGTGRSGDLPPRSECIPAWREALLAQLPALELTLVLGQYAQTYHFGNQFKSVTELVRSWAKYWPSQVALPHPSPRNNLWLKRNPWFELELIPALQKQIAKLLTKPIALS